VINDSRFLKTLSVRDQRAGIAEAIKVALIKDKVFFEWLEGHAFEFADVGSTAMHWLIQRCAQLHLEQICNGGDPFETGNARPLDYGHWSAHKIEVLSGYHLNHGEAVAIGMALDALYAVDEGILDESAAVRVLSLLQTVGFCLWHPCLHEHTETGESCLLEGLEEFRQHLGGHLCVTLLLDIGCSTEVDHINKSSVFRARERLKLLSCA
jgi:3-dehydroquinate synthase